MFARTLQRPDWDRFLHYAKRVRHLVYIEAEYTRDAVLTVEALHDFTTTCPLGAIFPLLQSANLSFKHKHPYHARFFIHFMHAGLKRLSIEEDAAGMRYIMMDIPKFAPRLEMVKLRIVDMAKDTPVALAAMFKALPNLREISLSSHLLSAVLASSLSKHSRLTILSQDSSSFAHPTWPHTSYQRTLLPTDFENLEVLRLDVDLTSLVHWLHTAKVLPSLRTFRVDLRSLEPPHKIGLLHTAKQSVAACRRPYFRSLYTQPHPYRNHL